MNRNAGDTWNEIYRKTEEYLNGLSHCSMDLRNVEQLDSEKTDLLSNLLSLQSMEREERIKLEKLQAERWKSDRRLSILSLITGLLTFSNDIWTISVAALMPKIQGIHLRRKCT